MKQRTQDLRGRNLAWYNSAPLDECWVFCEYHGWGFPRISEQQIKEERLGPPSEYGCTYCVEHNKLLQRMFDSWWSLEAFASSIAPDLSTQTNYLGSMWSADWNPPDWTERWSRTTQTPISFRLEMPPDKLLPYPMHVEITPPTNPLKKRMGFYSNDD